MFLIWPLLLILLSVICISAVVYRKKSFLEKLYIINTAGDENRTSVLNGADFTWLDYGTEFFPELEALLKRFKFHEHRTLWLLETEKLLRRIRVIFLRVDRVSDGLIKKIRRVNMNGQLNSQIISESVESKKEPIMEDTSVITSQNFLKNEEERMIIEIAKNPKDSKLYESLGDIYVEMKGWLDAKESYEAAIELNSQNEVLRQKLSSVLGKIIPQN